MSACKKVDDTKVYIKSLSIVLLLNYKQNMTKKIVSLFVAFMLVAAVFGGVTASAQSISELQAMIASLTQQLAALSGGTPATTGAAFTKDLSMGMSNADVMALQLALNTEVGAGLPGTNYFGALTKAAVIKFQVANGIPGTGYVGPLTRAALNAKQAPVVVPPTTSGNTGTTGTTLEGTFGTIQAVTKLSQYNAEEVGAGQSDVKVLGIEVEASNDGDIALRSMKLSMVETSNGSDNLDDYIKSVSIWKGSTKIGSADVDDFSESSNVYTKTIALDQGVVVKADAKEKFYVTVDAASNLDSTDIDDTTEWTIDIDNIRIEDGSGVVTTYTDAPVNALNVAINFVSFSDSADTKLKISKDSTSPDAGSVSVDTSDNTDDVVLLIGKLKLEGDSDVVIDAFPITLGTTTSLVSAVTNSVSLKIGDEVFTETVSTSNDATGVVTFDTSNYELAADQTVTFTVSADINDLEGTDFVAGDTLSASVTATNRAAIDAEDEEGDQLTDGTAKTGSAVGDAQSFFAEGVNIKSVSESKGTKDTNGDTAGGEQGTYTAVFELTAFGDDMYVPVDATIATSSVTTSAGTIYAIENSAGTQLMLNGAGLASTTAVVSSDADKDGNYFIVRDGETKKFTLQVTFTPDADGFYRLQMYGVNYNVAAAANADTMQLATPATDFESEYEDLDP